jgi:hypothetical protein
LATGVTAVHLLNSSFLGFRGFMAGDLTCASEGRLVSFLGRQRAGSCHSLGAFVSQDRRGSGYWRTAGYWKSIWVPVSRRSWTSWLPRLRSFTTLDVRNLESLYF